MAETQGRLTLWGIEVFLVTADEGTVSAAAKRLGVSVSGISQQLAALEAALGAELFDRSARPLRLTPAGEMFCRRARVIANEAAEARSELALGDLSGLTRFRLGMIEDFDSDVTPRLLAAMAQELKGCQFLLETGPSHRLLDQLDIRALDMVVCAETGPAAAWMEVHPLLSEPFVVAAPRDAVDPGGDVLAQLKALPLIAYSARHAMGRQIAAHLAHEEMRPAHRFELDSYHAIMAMVSEGLGWTILTPLGYLHAARFRDRADVLPLPFAPMSRRISLSARRGVLRDMPGEVADRLRGLLQEMVVTPALRRLPWLEGELQVL
ncbi:LysR family transcriptional regulator [Defluviimonas sp. 20V17]|uniref:DNA-binding transcriptional regulator, LysR family n=1 Tax=Allgaiera indica TaxID=765699 RepID=A0AAN4ZYG3_9RHOB|nr:LysR family transcriptional regulator [Allgaiera indica]KDB03766.1 LysR family transcriptional regulator [Defluviimonas sp. 20V17]GHD99979.1 LysR family transcriptional regulator [Allgaiera indica]SDW39472.1 DNA-binding transcriptional regulator, LysR family [Allgaiera indica]